MKILLLSFPLESERGGRSVLVSELGRALGELGHQVYWSSETKPDPKDTQHETVSNLTLHADELGIGSTNQELSSFIESLTNFLEKQQPDIIHCHKIGSIESLILKKISDAKSIPIVYTEHEAPTLGDEEFIGKRRAIFDRFDRIIFPSLASHQRIGWLFPSQSPKFVPITNGISEPKSAESQAVPMTVFFSGRHSSEKGLWWLLQSWKIVVRTLPEAVLTIAGEGDQTQEMMEWVATQGMDASLRWAGWLDRELNRKIASSHQIVVVPSLWDEPFGLTALEASWSGRPVVVSRVGALPEIVADGVTGICVEPGDIEELARAIMALLGNHEQSERLGHAGYERARQQFSIKHCAERHVILYEEVLAASGGQV